MTLYYYAGYPEPSHYNYHAYDRAGAHVSVKAYAPFLDTDGSSVDAGYPQATTSAHPTPIQQLPEEPLEQLSTYRARSPSLYREPPGPAADVLPPVTPYIPEYGPFGTEWSIGRVEEQGYEFQKNVGGMFLVEGDVYPAREPLVPAVPPVVVTAPLVGAPPQHAPETRGHDVGCCYLLIALAIFVTVCGATMYILIKLADLLVEWRRSTSIDQSVRFAFHVTRGNERTRPRVLVENKILEDASVNDYTGRNTTEDALYGLVMSWSSMAKPSVNDTN
ncbi:uncharacterized protein LOC135365996 isoform X1 [Ornithodoros turicata]|uniref:uncharacterized protein LOC135365996 isoform X1 n=1 Tax=Ornithodoros turicata TaxID=34597 RepID=UPI0031393ECE